MTTHVSCIEFLFGHEGRQPTTLPGLSRTVSMFELAVDNASGRSDPLPQPQIPLSCYYGNSTVEFRRSPCGTFVGSVENAGPGNVAAIADGIDPAWHINGAYADNSGATPIAPAYPELEFGRNAPPLVAGFAGAALTAARAGSTLVSMSGTIQYAYHQSTDYMGLAHACDFEETPPDSDSDGTQIVTRVTRLLQAPSNSVNLGTDAVGNDIIIKQCAAALIDPSATVYVLSTDLGIGPSQIPPSVGENTAPRFRAHPSVFIRSARARYCRSVDRKYRDAIAINTGNSGLPIRIVELDSESPPILQNWLIICDGVPAVVSISITSASSGRPRDVWNEIWVPLINADSSTGNAPLTNSFQDVGTVLRGPAASQLRLKFLEYARCLPMPGDNVTQTGGSPA
jgi:hypothetical protein